MIDVMLVVCVAVMINAAYAAAGLSAAARSGISLSLRDGAGLGVMLLGTAAECAALAMTHDWPARGMLLAGFGAVVTGAACDAVCGYVFDAITLSCLIAMLALSLALQTVAGFTLGAAATGGSLAILYAITRGRGLGLGDVKLACCIGGSIGAFLGVEALGIAFVIGGAYAAFLLATKRATRRAELRFAPYLAAGMAIVMLHGPLQ